jgi:hypothetical protein
MNEQHVLIHYHIFKNAGTSVDVSLKHSFRDRWGTFEGSHAHAVQSSDKLGEFISANRHLVAVSSHLARPPVPHPGCLPVVFLRHPLLRAYSVYNFTRTDSSQPFSQITQDLKFADYIIWALRKGRGSIVIRNYQVVHLSEASWRTGHILDASATFSDLKQACQLLDDWGIAGVVEEFELSARTIQTRYSARLPGLEFLPRWENATQKERVSVEDRIGQLKDLLGETLYSDFMEANHLDLALHAHAKSVLNKAVQAIDLIP